MLAANYFLLHKHSQSVIAADSRNNGIEVRAHYAYLVDPNTMVFDLRDVSSTNSQADVFRVFLQFAEELEDREFETVILAYAGTPKFMLEGEYFQKLGREFGTQNPVYTIRTFPSNVYELDGTRAFNEWSGGLLGVATRQMKDFGEFNKQWYLQEMSLGR